MSNKGRILGFLVNMSKKAQMKTKKDSDTLKRIIGNIERSREFNKENIDRYNLYRKTVYKCTITDAQSNAFNKLNKPIVEANIIEAHLNRIREQFNKRVPGITVMIQDGIDITEEVIEQRDIIEGHIRQVISEANADGTQQALIQEIASGGFSASKVIAEYKEGPTFSQKIVWKKARETTQVGFDILAREISKKDSEYCYELFTQSKERVEEEYGVKLDDIEFKPLKDGFEWFYKIQDKEVVAIADYYEKQYETVDIVKLSSGEVIEKKEYERREEDRLASSEEENYSMEALPIVRQERKWSKEKIIRYKIIGNTILSEERVEAADVLPYVFFDGNSVALEGNNKNPELMTRPYLYNSLGAQTLYNNIMSSLADQCQNLSNHKYLIAKESISKEYKDHLINPQDHDSLIWQAYDNNVPDKMNPKPEQLMRNAFPPEMLALFQYVPILLQHILGSYDAQAGINETELSGEAILQGRINSSRSGEPVIGNYMISLNRVGEIVVKLIPSVHIDATHLPIINSEGEEKYVPVNGPGQVSLKYNPLSFKIKVEAGPSSEMQKANAVSQITQMSSSLPGFAEFIQEKGLGVAIDNMTIEGASTLKALYKEYVKEKEERVKMMAQNQQAQQDPRVMREESRREEIMLSAEKNNTAAQIDAANLALDQEELSLKKVELLAKMKTEDAYIDLEEEKLHASLAEKVVKNAIDSSTHQHNKDMDHANHQHKLMQTHHRITGRPHFTHE